MRQSAERAAAFCRTMRTPQGLPWGVKILFLFLNFVGPLESKLCNHYGDDFAENGGCDNGAGNDGGQGGIHRGQRSDGNASEYQRNARMGQQCEVEIFRNGRLGLCEFPAQEGAADFSRCAGKNIEGVEQEAVDQQAAEYRNTEERKQQRKAPLCCCTGAS